MGGRQALAKRPSSGCRALAMFPERLLAWNYRQTRRFRLNSRPNKHRRRLLSWGPPSIIVAAPNGKRRRSRREWERGIRSRKSSAEEGEEE
eukprot:11805107-Heterocapsa_arctica.AAC.1